MCIRDRSIALNKVYVIDYLMNVMREFLNICPLFLYVQDNSVRLDFHSLIINALLTRYGLHDLSYG